MDPERLDLSPLDPSRRDPARWDRLVRAIMAAAGPELERRAAIVGPVIWLARFARPALAAAALIALASAAVLHAGTRSVVSPAVAPAGVAEALAVPSPVAAWLAGNRSPTTSDVLAAVEGDMR